MVGIETGDVKHNTRAPILCLTQEIYTNKYADTPNAYLVVDEFHYITQDPDRARAYIDGIRKTHPGTKILAMSATLGNPAELANYLGRLAGRPFVHYETDFRPVPQRFLEEGLPLRTIAKKNAIIFLFSAKGVYDGPISKNEFLQMAGRAGRKGYFNEGIIGYHSSVYEAKGYQTDKLFRLLLRKDPEPMTVDLSPDWQKILLNERTREEEASYIALNSLPRKDPGLLLRHLEEELAVVESKLETLADDLRLEGKKVTPEELRELMGRAYCDTFSFDENFALLAKLASVKYSDLSPLKVRSFLDLRSFLPMHKIDFPEAMDGKDLNLLLQL